jgi:hypothetical protein
VPPASQQLLLLPPYLLIPFNSEAPLPTTKRIKYIDKGDAADEEIPDWARADQFTGTFVGQ